MTVEEVHHRLRRTLGGPVLVVGERAVNHDWSRAFSLASRCAAVMRAIGHTDLGATTGRYALYAMIFDTERVRELDRFISDSIGPRNVSHPCRRRVAKRTLLRELTVRLVS